MIVVSEAWKTSFPGATTGFLAVRGVTNPEGHAGLDERARLLEAELRERLGGRDRAALRAQDPVPAYAAHYHKHGKTYHVLLQLESVALKGKSVPPVAALVKAMFLAELKNLLLTAGHDLDQLHLPVTLGVAGRERYTLLSGREQELTAGDMMMADELGVISSVLDGPDSRTRLGPETTSVLFAVYAPQGVGRQAVLDHLGSIRDNVLLVAPEAAVELLAAYP